MTYNILVVALGLVSASAIADTRHASTTSTADDHAPIGVMGDHMHRKGEWMVSYRYMQMDMQGNKRGDKDISPEDIVSTVANRFGPPPTLRVVPLSMTTQMHMVGTMYAPSDQVTLMGMVNFIEKDMEHVTFRGPAGTQRLGNFTTRTSGWGDTKIGALIKAFDTPRHKLHWNAGLSIPTGSIRQTASVLTPMNMRMTMRTPYPMQLGSGTYDLEPGVTYRGFSEQLGWGAQLKSVIRLGQNSEHYTLGNQLHLTGWASYQLSAALSSSLRLKYTDTGSIDGADPVIRAPVQTADPQNQGAARLSLAVGINVLPTTGLFAGHRLAIEYETVLDEDVNGVQMSMDDMLSIGYQYAF